MYKRTQTRKPSKSQAATRIQRAWRRRKSNKNLPLRFKYSKKQYNKNVKFVNQAAGVLERKVSPITKFDEKAPNATAVGSQTYYSAYVLGSGPPTAWSGTWLALDGMAWAQGNGNNQRQGRFMFLDKTTLSLSIQMNNSLVVKSPIQFRMVVFRARRATTPTGIVIDPATALFLDSDGSNFGPLSSGKSFTDINLQPLNYKDFQICLDKRFTLSSHPRASSAEDLSFNMRYPVFKNFRLTMNHKCKTTFSSQEPIDYDYKYGIIIMSGSVGRDELADNWEVNIRGATTALDG